MCPYAIRVRPQMIRWRTNKSRLQNSTALSTIMWRAMGRLNTRLLINLMLFGSSGLGIDYSATLVPVGLMHRLYSKFLKDS